MKKLTTSIFIKIQNTKVLFLILFFSLGIFALMYIYPENYPVIKSDGVGYYLYLPAIFIYHDISLQSIATDIFNGLIPSWTGANLYLDTNNYLIKYPIGEAILMSPFFFIAYFISYLLELKIDGFSYIFQYSMAFSGLFYATFGLALLWSLLKDYFTTNTIVISLIAIIFATNFFHYATYDNIFSHIYSFFLFTALLCLTKKIYAKPIFLYFALLGLIYGMMIITRPTNGLTIIIILLYGISSYPDLSKRIIYLKENVLKLSLAVLSAFLIISLQLIYWKIVTGNFISYSYGNESFDFLKPEIFNGLFSIRKGLFFWSPILLLIFPAIYYMKQKTPDFFLSIIIYLPVMTYITFSWWNWWYGGSFGSRPYVEALPLFALAIASVYESVSRFTKKILIFLIALSSLISLFLMYNYWIGRIPYEGTSGSVILNLFQQSPKPKLLNNPRVSYELIKPYDETSKSITIKVTNNGNEIWIAGFNGKYGLALSYMLENKSKGIKTGYDEHRFHLPDNIKPKESFEINIPIRGLADGENIVSISMVQELVFWFHDRGNEVLKIYVDKEDG